jgi:hypothetical protein
VEARVEPPQEKLREVNLLEEEAKEWLGDENSIGVEEATEW